LSTLTTLGPEAEEPARCRVLVLMSDPTVSFGQLTAAPGVMQAPECAAVAVGSTGGAKAARL
jgi:hypothetical protein